jgi:hypothetical protein
VILKMPLGLEKTQKHWLSDWSENFPLQHPCAVMDVDFQSLQYSTKISRSQVIDSALEQQHLPNVENLQTSVICHCPKPED